MFEPGNQAAKKDESQLSQTENAKACRARLARIKAAKAAQEHRAAEAKVRDRQAMIAKYGLERVEAQDRGEAIAKLWHEIALHYENKPFHEDIDEGCERFG